VHLILQLLLVRSPPLGVEPPVLPLDILGVIDVGIAFVIAFACLVVVVVLVVVVFVLRGRAECLAVPHGCDGRGRALGALALAAPAQSALAAARKAARASSSSTSAVSSMKRLRERLAGLSSSAGFSLAGS
jgi:hypothetical protein